jgi:ribosomal protein L39E
MGCKRTTTKKKVKYIRKVKPNRRLSIWSTLNRDVDVKTLTERGEQR